MNRFTKEELGEISSGTFGPRKGGRRGPEGKSVYKLNRKAEQAGSSIACRSEGGPFVKAHCPSRYAGKGDNRNVV